VRLVDLHPSLGGEELLARFVPPRRFADARFATFVPDPTHPSQAEALARVEALAKPPDADGRGFFGRRKAESNGPPGLYLDGGFGVGKTHLIAALWHASPGPGAFLTFGELTALIGFIGMDRAVAAFAGHRLISLDEFELDDVANTLMTVTFLRRVLAGGDLRVATTSNSLPDRLGEGRFSAEDFKREIAAIAEHFEVVRIDGPDVRARQTVLRETVPPGEVAEVLATADPATTSDDGCADLLAHLREVHPVQYGPMVDAVDTVVIRDLVPITNQGDALLLVALIDELYDAGTQVLTTGCGVGELFDPSYRHGGYRKKYGRAESRLSAMLGESTTGAGGDEVALD
jgi:cell division protein ZapE